MSITTEPNAAEWFADRAKNTPMPGAKYMFELAAAALREKAEREDPKPLTFVELLQMDDVPFYVRMVDPLDETEWNPHYYPAIYDNVGDVDVAIWCGSERDYLPFDEYGKTWLAYRHKPKEG